MTTEEKRKEVDALKSSANEAKDRLVRIMYDLREIGANREANGLQSVIIRLETWQNR